MMVWLVRALGVFSVLFFVSGCQTTRGLNDRVAPPATAENGWHFLTFGGGYLPSGNQVSLESNVRYLNRSLARVDLELASSHLLFADGVDPNRDLQLYDDETADAELSEHLAVIMGSHRDIAYTYRNSDVSADGPCLLKAIDGYFDEAASKYDANDSLLVYYTGHGGRGDRKSQNTDLRLWDREVMNVTAFCQRLDKVPNEVPVTVVMVQCYSGGFANIIFKEGDPKKGLSESPRCGFFSTIHSRVAAGCTPEIIEADYEEYSTHFWAALFGQSRMGEPVAKPDYNGDGKVGFNEAHAYTLIEANTIDVCVKTSDTLLRHYSHFAPRPKPKKKDAKPQPPLPDGVKFAKDVSNEFVLNAADSAEKAVIEALVTELELSEGSYYHAVRKAIEASDAEGKKLAATKKKLGGEIGKMRKSFGLFLLKKWPELGHRFSPKAGATISRQGDDILAALKAHPDYPKLEEITDKQEENQKQSTAREKKWVKCQRLMRQIENVVARENLSKVASTDVVTRYNQLRKLEARVP